MKTIKHIILYLGIMTFLASCNDFLDVNPTTAVPNTEVFKTTQGAQSALDGCYYLLRCQGSGGTNRQDDWGIPTLQLTFDACGLDIVVPFEWYTYDYGLSWKQTRSENYKPAVFWTFLYRVVTNVNPIINEIDKAEGDEADKKYIKGQALAMRGWAYFNLIRLFQQTYIIAKDMPGVPIYTETTVDTTEGKARASVEAVYKRITDDLEEAVALLNGFSRGSEKNLINKQVAQSILAEVYLTMNNWVKAASNARAARQGYSLMTKEQFQAGFNDITNPEWIWGMEQTLEQNMGDYSVFSFWDRNRKYFDEPKFAWKNFYLCADFVEMFEANDVRKQFQSTGDDLYSSGKFRDASNCLGSMVFTRSAAMLLTEAEALARTPGGESEAKTLLWELQDKRNTGKTQSSGQELIDAILKERRKELYGEGYAWFDLIRNQLPLDRRNLRGHTDHTYYPAHSWRFIYQIPIYEVTNNENISSDYWPAGTQNPLEGIYIPQ